MSLVEEQREYCEKEEQEEEEQEQEEEEEEEEEVMTTSKLPFTSPSSSSTSPAEYKNFLPEHHNLWPPIGSFDHQSQQNKSQELPSLNFDRQLEFMVLSLGNNSNNEADHSSSGAPAGASAETIIEREHMFDKVVTPSDVGKLNRLVIPKQHAEKYFPLDSSSTEKGLLLNFEDRNGKPWRFRYSYWNSSQSYVMTKGWSRFVKEKKLDAGDIVSFQRGVGESGKHRLFIDWRRRPNAAPDPTSFPPDLQHQLINHPQSVRWGRLYSLPQSNLSMPPLQYHYHPQPAQFHHLNYSIQPYNQQHQPTMMTTSFRNATPYHLRPAGGLRIGGMHHQQGIRGHHVPMVIDSVPVVHGKTAGKRLRLFGVNMECSPPPSQDESQITRGATVGSFSPHNLASSSLPPLQLRVPATSAPTPTMQAAEFPKKGKTTSLSFDLDL